MPDCDSFSVIAIEADGRCDGVCSYCPQGTGRAISDGPITERTLQKALDLALQGRSRALLLHARGEPFLHPELDCVVDSVRKRGFLAFVSTGLIGCTREMIRRVLLAGINQIEIHYDAAEQFMTRGEVGSLLRYIVLANQRIRNSACRLEVNHALSRDPAGGSLEEVTAKLAWVPAEVPVRTYYPYDWHSLVSDTAHEDAKIECKWLKHKCCTVLSNGDIAICCLDQFKLSSIENVARTERVTAAHCSRRDMCRKCAAKKWGRDWIGEEMLAVSDERKRLLKRDPVMYALRRIDGEPAT